MRGEGARAYRIFAVFYVALLALGFVVFVAGVMGALTEEAFSVPAAWDGGLDKVFIALAQIFPTAALIPLALFRWWAIPIGVGMDLAVVLLLWRALVWNSRAQIALVLALGALGPALYLGATWLSGYLFLSKLGHGAGG